MTQSTTATPSIPMGKLLHALRMAGFSISVEQVLEMQRAFLSISFHETRVDEIKYLITPIIARDAASQQRIHSIIDAFVEDATPKKPIKKTTAKPSNDLSPVKLFFYIFGVLLVLAALFKIATTKKETPYPSTSIGYKKVPKDDSSGTTAPAQKKEADTIASSKKQEAAKPLAKLGYGFKVQALEDIQLVEEPRNINKQLCLIFGILTGIILSFVIFSVKQKEEEQTGKRKQNIEEESQPEGTGSLTKLDFPDKGSSINSSKPLLAIKNILGRLGTSSNQVMDVQKSIQHTIQNAGFYTPAFTYQKQARHYLILVDEKNYDGHMISLFNYLISQLKEATLNINHYKYHKSLLNVKDQFGHVYSLAKLASMMPNHQLLIFSNSREILVQEDELKNAQLLSILSTWESKSVITPVPIADWLQEELSLQANGFNLVPAEMAAIEFLARCITTGQPLGKDSLLRKIPETYSVDTADFSSVDGLWHYMNDGLLFQCLCCLAVYPKLDWNLTLTMYESIYKQLGGNGNDYDNLLKICRIPWMQESQMDEALRLILLQYMDTTTEGMARETIVALLDEALVSAADSKLTQQEAADQLLLNQFLLYAYNRKQFAVYANTPKRVANNWEAIGDSTLKQLISSGKSKMMPLNKTGQHLTIKEFVVKEEEREVRKVTFLRCLTILIPPTIIYLLLITFRPDFAYPAGAGKEQTQQVKFLITKKDCLMGVDSIFIDQQAQKIRKPQDTIYLPNVGYNDNIGISYTFKGTERKAVIDGRHGLYMVELNECK